MLTSSCKSPAKIILTGDYAVLHAVPSLSIALNLNIKAFLYFSTDKSPSITFKLIGKKDIFEFSFNQWQQRAQDIEERYQLFLNKSISIKQVLVSNVDLIISTIFHFSQFHPIKSGKWLLKIQNNTWIGKGLGSSASLIVSILKSLCEAHNIVISNSKLNLLAQKIENRQHGNSSGLDTATVIYGGILKYSTNPKRYTPLPYYNFKAYIIDTGTPSTSTGECVQHVQKHFAPENSIWQEFAKVSQQIETAWIKHNVDSLNQGIRQNQKLLQQLGVVPIKVQKFIQEATYLCKSSAKICGSGSIGGDNSGVVLFIGAKEPTEICKKWGYTYKKINISKTGVQCLGI